MYAPVSAWLSSITATLCRTRLSSDPGERAFLVEGVVIGERRSAPAEEEGPAHGVSRRESGCRYSPLSSVLTSAAALWSACAAETSPATALSSHLPMMS